MHDLLPTVTIPKPRKCQGRSPRWTSLAFMGDNFPMGRIPLCSDKYKLSVMLSITFELQSL